MDAAPLGGAGGCFRAFVFCCTKRGRACDTSNERANALHAANERRRAASSSSHVGAVPSLSIFGAVCFSCSYGIASTRRPSVSILSTLSIFGRAVWTLPRAALFVFWAFSIRRARAFVLVSYSLNAGRCHIGRRLDVVPRGGLVCVEVLASCCTKRTGRVIRPTKGRTLHTGQKNSTGRPLLLYTAGVCPRCPYCPYLGRVL